MTTFCGMRSCADPLTHDDGVKTLCASRRLFGLQLACNHPLQRPDRLEILGRDLSLRDREIEFGFDRQHQVDHVHRGQPDIHQPRLGVHFRHDRVLFEDRLDQRKDPALDIGVEVLHLRLPFLASKIRHRGIGDAENRQLQFEVICRALFERQRLSFERSRNSNLNANEMGPGFCDQKNRGLTVNAETAGIYPDIRRRI
jgi:hypothetical protein